MSDPVADMLTRIRNAILRKHKQVQIPFSVLKERILKVLEEEGFINKFSKEGEKTSILLIVSLKYVDEESVIRSLKKVSKPGLRKYESYLNLKPVLNGQGIHVVSTSKGVIADKECRETQIGGEILCTIY